MPSTLQAQATPTTIAIIGGGFSGSLAAATVPPEVQLEGLTDEAVAITETKGKYGFVAPSTQPPGQNLCCISTGAISSR